MLAPSAFAQTGSGSTPPSGAVGDSIRAGAAPPAGAAPTVAPNVVDEFDSGGDSITVVGGVPDATASPAADNGGAAPAAAEAAPAP
ncbi:MAG TPA: hypothetical protein VNF27_00085, partial [Candidatus Binataceae bacterium]|nr:hypothetical protein [Candidatus Binataceae bacterium]